MLRHATTSGLVLAAWRGGESRARESGACESGKSRRSELLAWPEL